MPVSETTLIERIARVLAGRRFSVNGDGIESQASISVDMEWKDRIDDAVAILRTMREPDAAMAVAGDVETWRAMVAAALDTVDTHDDGNPLAPPTINIRAAS